MKKPKVVELNPEEMDSLKCRIQNNELTEMDRTLFLKLLEFCLWLQFQLQEAKLSIKRLCGLFGISSEKSNRLPQKEASKKEKPLLPEELEQEFKDLEKESNSLPKKKSKRLKESDYTGAENIHLPHDSLKAGDPCPTECGGRLYALKPGAVIRLTGHPIASAKRYIYERLRCALCGEVFKATPPGEKYDSKLKAVLSLCKYYMGLPFFRMERMQTLLGVPLPDATQWDLVEQVANCLYPIFIYLETLAAEGNIIQNDDTKVRILSLIQENKQEPERKRKGMQTTGILSHVQGRKIALFYSGRDHSGENMTDLLLLRPGEMGPPQQMCDALPANVPKETKTILCNCLAHARRKFFEIYSAYPEPCGKVIQWIAFVYRIDTLAKKKCLNPEERLKLHQKWSKPVMDSLKIWLDEQINDALVEPNSSLGKAIEYCRKRWTELTQFLRLPGALLDNNLQEQALKIPIRNRKNAMFYKTEHGALVGDILISIIYNCELSKENPIDYLVAIQENRKAVRQSPEDWLPWNYNQQLNPQECAA